MAQDQNVQDQNVKERKKPIVISAEKARQGDILRKP